jgi:hypothetical protein
MTKGHNKGETNDRDPQNKGQGQDRHLTNKKKEKAPDHGRNPDPDPSEGTKGQNAI